MADKLVLCRTCGKPCPDGYCDKHTKPKADGKYARNRLPPHKRGYDWTWRKASKRQLMKIPFCEDCMSRGELRDATEVHHRIKLTDRPDLKYDSDNLMSLCTQCHSIRSRRGE